MHLLLGVEAHCRYHYCHEGDKAREQEGKDVEDVEEVSVGGVQDEDICSEAGPTGGVSCHPEQLYDHHGGAIQRARRIDLPTVHLAEGEEDGDGAHEAQGHADKGCEALKEDENEGVGQQERGADSGSSQNFTFTQKVCLKEIFVKNIKTIEKHSLKS